MFDLVPGSLHFRKLRRKPSLALRDNDCLVMSKDLMGAFENVGSRQITTRFKEIEILTLHVLVRHLVRRSGIMNSHALRPLACDIEHTSTPTWREVNTHGNIELRM